MNTKLIHSVILMLLLSLTAHEVHASISHDVETCDVCVHFHSNDDALTDNAQQYLILDVSLHLKINGQLNPYHISIQTTADFIRGPPQFS